MAKGKHSAALFEVINKGNNPDGVGQSLRTPKWWFKSRPASPASGEPQVSYPAPETSAPAMTMPPPRPAPRPTSASQSASRSSAVHMDFDRGRKEITLRLRYTTALVSAFAVCALVGLAYIIGRHLNRGPQTASAAPALAQVVPQYAHQFPQPGVTDVTRQHLPRPQVTNPTPTRTIADPPVSPAPRDAGPPTLVPAGAETRLPRTIGLNYVIIQTYPNEESKTAEATCEFLSKNGIPCTLERTDFARNWICLVGTAGFTKISSADFKTYVDNIISLGKQFPSSHFDRIQPAAYKWKAPSGS